MLVLTPATGFHVSALVLIVDDPHWSGITDMYILLYSWVFPLGAISFSPHTFADVTSSLLSIYPLKSFLFTHLNWELILELLFCFISDTVSGSDEALVISLFFIVI